MDQTTVLVYRGRRQEPEGRTRVSSRCRCITWKRPIAAGKIPGGFFKREGGQSEKETLTSRLIDRPIRPLFPKGFMNEVQVICTVMSPDKHIDPDIAAMIGTSAALAISGCPFNGPIGAARVGFTDEQGLHPEPDLCAAA